MSNTTTTLFFVPLCCCVRGLLLLLCMLVRLSARLNRGRMATALPELRAVAARDRLQIEFPAGWLAEHPLTLADLEEEVDALRGLGVQLKCG